MAKERRCICCNKAYKYCGQCKEYSNLPAWMNEFCSEECKELFNIMSVYNMGYADKSQIEKVIKKYNITDYSKYKSSTANKLNVKNLFQLKNLNRLLKKRYFLRILQLKNQIKLKKLNQLRRNIILSAIADSEERILRRQPILKSSIGSSLF